MVAHGHLFGFLFVYSLKKFGREGKYGWQVGGNEQVGDRTWVSRQVIENICGLRERSLQGGKTVRNTHSEARGQDMDKNHI